MYFLFNFKVVGWWKILVFQVLGSFLSLVRSYCRWTLLKSQAYRGSIRPTHGYRARRRFGGWEPVLSYLSLFSPSFLPSFLPLHTQPNYKAKPLPLFLHAPRYSALLPSPGPPDRPLVLELQSPVAKLRYLPLRAVKLPAHIKLTVWLCPYGH
jgi:hypothetical protein